MDNTLVTTDLILSTLKQWVETKTVVDAHTWVEASLKLNILISDEHDKLFKLEQEVAQMKVHYIEDGKSVAYAKTKVEATDLYRLMRIQRAKIEQIEEAIKIAKVQARLKDTEMRNY